MEVFIGQGWTVHQLYIVIFLLDNLGNPDCFKHPFHLFACSEQLHAIDLKLVHQMERTI